MILEATSESNAWLGWPLWTFIATVAQVLSLLAIFFAVYELSQRLRVIQFDFIPHRVGALVQGVDRYHVIDFFNTGNVQRLSRIGSL